MNIKYYNLSDEEGNSIGIIQSINDRLCREDIKTALERHFVLNVNEIKWLDAAEYDGNVGFRFTSVLEDGRERDIRAQLTHLYF